jgi:hypothetical protein
MKAAFLVLAACILAIVAGSGLSIAGFQASSATVTVTGIQTFSTATTVTNETIATTTTQASVQSDVLEHTYNIPSPTTLGNCGMYDNAYAKLDPGTLSISFTVTGSDVVDFWVLNSQQWTTWQSITDCQAVESYPGLTSILGVNSWTTTLDVPATGIYYFVFLNKNPEGVSISLSVKEGFSVQTTAEIFLTSYSTQSSTWLTSASVASQQPAGLGPAFYLGIALVVVGVVAAFLYYTRKRARETYGQEGSPVTVEVPPQEPVVVPVPSKKSRAEDTPNMFCPYCGKELPAGSTFCNACEKEIEP